MRKYSIAPQSGSSAVSTVRFRSVVLRSRIRAKANSSIFDAVHERLTGEDGTRLAGLLDTRRSDGTTEFNHLKMPAKSPRRSHFRARREHLEWVDGLGPSGDWSAGIAAGKVTDFAGEAEATEAAGMRDHTLIKWLAILAFLVHKARMRARDDLAAMFCKRVALKVKAAKAELAAMHEKQQATVEALIGNYRTLLQHVDTDGPAQQAGARADELTGELLQALTDPDDVEDGALSDRLGGGVAPALKPWPRPRRCRRPDCGR